MYSGSYKSPETYKGIFPDSTDKTQVTLFIYDELEQQDRFNGVHQWSLSAQNDCTLIGRHQQSRQLVWSVMLFLLQTVARIVAHETKAVICKYLWLLRYTTELLTNFPMRQPIIFTYIEMWFM